MYCSYSETIKVRCGGDVTQFPGHTKIHQQRVESSLAQLNLRTTSKWKCPSWVFIGRTDVEAETPILWPPNVKSWLIWKDPDTGKDWGQEEKGMTEDEMAGWHHWLNGHEFGWTLGVGDGQGGLACCSSWSRKELDTTERLNWTELNVNKFCTSLIPSKKKIINFWKRSKKKIKWQKRELQGPLPPWVRGGGGAGGLVKDSQNQAWHNSGKKNFYSNQGNTKSKIRWLKHGSRALWHFNIPLPQIPI